MYDIDQKKNNSEIFVYCYFIYPFYFIQTNIYYLPMVKIKNKRQPKHNNKGYYILEYIKNYV